MPVSPAACERITSTLSHLIRTGRHISARAATQIYGDLPSFGWTLLVPLERDGEQRCSALAAQAGVDVSVVSRQVAALERAGHVARRPWCGPFPCRAAPTRPTGAPASSPSPRPVRPLSPPPVPSVRTGPRPPSPAGTSRTPSGSASCSTASWPTSRRRPWAPSADQQHPARPINGTGEHLSTTVAAEAPVEQQGRMTHRQILEALSGMMLAMFVAFLSSTVVSNALPTIITDLHGTQSQYTWVVAATLLASTV